MSVPPRPWRIAALHPGDARVYVVDAKWAGVINAALRRELAEFIVAAVNEREGK